MAEAPRFSSPVSVEIRTSYINSHPSFAKGCSARAILQRKRKLQSLAFSKSCGETF